LSEIIVYFDPEIDLIKMSIPNQDTNQGYKQEINYGELAGFNSPFIILNNFKFYGNSVKYFSLTVHDFLPKISLVLQETEDMFTSNFYPAKDDIISLYIKSQNKDFKSIRQDFKIFDIDSTKSGNKRIHSIEGFLNVPRIFTEIIKSFGKKTSIEVLKTIAKDLKLGFASNESQTDDLMIRICPNISYYEFIQKELIKTSYKNDDCFYTVFIDQYYYLNFVEVNSLFKNNKIENTSINYFREDFRRNDPKIKSFSKELIFTNHEKYLNTPSYIQDYKIINKKGEIFKNIGYRSLIQYYDSNKKSIQEFFIDSLENQKPEKDELPIKSNSLENYKEFYNSVYFNNQNENVHQNYYYSIIQNNINNLELNKINLILNFIEFNYLSSMYKMVPVVIFVKDQVQKDIFNNKNKQNEMLINKFISGFYLIKGIQIEYLESTGYRTNNIVTKREFYKEQNN
jgi:hypothetical protein